MNLKTNIILIFILTCLFGCSKQWDEHYTVASETIDENVWDAMQRESDISSFVGELKNNKYDTLFQTNNTFTLFIPTNAAMEEYKSGNVVNKLLLDYLITPHFIQSADIKGKRKIQTLGQKFILFENGDGKVEVDGVPILSESPLYKNGKFYVVDKVVEVKPNLYEFFAERNPILRDYIDAQDSIVLDKEKSDPIGFNDNGDIVYDTVANIINRFEELYFPVKKESRYESATIVFPLSDDYNSALTEMAQNLNSAGMQDYNDIPVEWQDRVLIPFLLNQGVFGNMLEQDEFLWTQQTNEIRLKNILGDTIVIPYKPVDKTICSNGYAYNYESFHIPDSLYMNPFVLEAEELLQQTGVDKYAWKESVKVQSDMSFTPEKTVYEKASNDSLLSLIFPQGYDGNFSVEFNMPPQFPRKYILVVSTNMHYGGIYDIYVNDKLAGTFDYYDFITYRGYNYSSVTGERYFPNGNLNKFDVLVDNVTEYKPVKIKFVYTGPGEVFDNGFIIDNIALKPYQ